MGGNNDSLDAMVAYAQSIEQIVDAGNKGAESARQVAESVKRLVDAVKVDAITGASAKVVELSTDTIAFVYGEYAKHIATKGSVAKRAGRKSAAPWVALG